MAHGTRQNNLFSAHFILNSLSQPDATKKPQGANLSSIITQIKAWVLMTLHAYDQSAQELAQDSSLRLSQMSQSRGALCVCPFPST
jgi:hypothetical protein